MFKRSLINLSSLTTEKICDFINAFDTVLTDCDGVLWIENKALQGSPNVINKLLDMGKQIFFVTNNSSKSRQDLTVKANKLGYNVTKEAIVCTSFLAANYLKSKNYNQKTYVVGMKGIGEELDLVGIKHTGIGIDNINKDLATTMKKLKLLDDIGAVIVGFDEQISYPKMLKAATYANNPACHFLATSPDERFPVDVNIVMPGPGAIIKAIETGAEKCAHILGKPCSYMADYIIKTHGVDPKRTLMIGDRCNTDILFGNRFGFITLLVLSGVTNLQEVEDKKKSRNQEDLDLIADFYLKKLGDLERYV